MVGKRLLASVGAALQFANPNTAEVFGNVDMLFFGDFYQLPCVGDSPVYTKLTDDDLKHFQYNGDRSMIGQWDQLTHSVQLTEVMRQNEDQDIFKLTLNAVRIGDVGQEQYELLESRVVGTPDVPNLDDFADAIFIVLEHKMRRMLNEKLAIKRAKAIGKDLFRFQCRYTRTSSARSSPPPNDQQKKEIEQILAKFTRKC
jgi:hypothetical protein